MKKRVIECELIGTLEAKEDTVVVMVRRPDTHPPSPEEVKAVGEAVHQAFGYNVMAVLLGPNEHIETLSESEMAKRGWVRGTMSGDGKTSIRRTS